MENKEPKTRSNSMIDRLTFIASSALIALLVTAPLIFYIDYRKVKIGTINVQSLVVEHERNLTNLLYQGVKNTESDQVDLTQQTKIAEVENQRFAKKLDIAVKKVSEECNCILINKAALLADTTRATDYTQQVKSALKD
ncbi:hypothetical protein ABTC85_15625 [Acinetobacter baumannii]|uniref:Uncharacterized protein n=1 Tax=Acinetobacter baumannii TaxID=470 RepID=A0A0C4Y4K8_ACIBA|nr:MULTISPECIES: hypothetical protein [Acinetobacter calcoaceticus/baumannii complex]AFI97419.1 hypothetical protein ABTJ_p0041 [Acinetobacter baumannii MDR-TJ]AGQ12315.1 hypothetical protein BJAB0868_p0058 [Acinetobacter baumannii BJAB0868]AGQ16176.1 hypothetical protein BJAB07104_p0048 [Acinetobacter baumannii BJAB07104]AJF79890.1 hypothetical protein NG19_0054 [Acinetobacter baumannii]APF45695.1 hypothetical protein BKJ37_19330 [Acinetobacter baumannii]